MNNPTYTVTFPIVAIAVLVAGCMFLINDSDKRLESPAIPVIAPALPTLVEVAFPQEVIDPDQLALFRFVQNDQGLYKVQLKRGTVWESMGNVWRTTNEAMFDVHWALKNIVNATPVHENFKPIEAR